MKKHTPPYRFRNALPTTSLTKPLLLWVLMSFAPGLVAEQTPEPDPLAAVRIALALRLEDDALAKIKKLPPADSPEQTIQRALLESAALIAQKRLHQALSLIERSLGNLAPQTPGVALLHYQKAIILAKQEDFPGARTALQEALAALPSDDPLRNQILVTAHLLPPEEKKNTPSEIRNDILRLHDSLPPGRERDLLALALLALTAPQDPLYPRISQLTEQLPNHPERQISATARYLRITSQGKGRKNRQLAEELDTLIKDRSAPTFIRSMAATQRALIHLREKEPDSARELAELAICSAPTPSARAEPLHIWWQTLPRAFDGISDDIQQLLEKTTTSAGVEAAAQIASVLSQKFSDSGFPKAAVSLILAATKLHPDPATRCQLLDTAVAQSIQMQQSEVLRAWLEDPQNQSLVPARSVFWLAFVELREGHLGRAQELISGLNASGKDPAEGSAALARLGHAAITLAEDPEAPLDTSILRDFTGQQTVPIMKWLMSIKLLTASARGHEQSAIQTTKTLLTDPTQSDLYTIIAAAKNAQDNDHLTLAQKILDSIPEHLRDQHWQLRALLLKIADGQISPTQEPGAWMELLPRLTRADLITLATERLAAACWNIANYACAFSEWSKLLADTALTPRRRAEITYFAALAARRSGNPAKALELLHAITGASTSGNKTPQAHAEPQLVCDALLEMARIGLENPELVSKPLDQLAKIITLAGCGTDTAAIAAILLAENLLQQNNTDSAPDIEKITDILKPIFTDARISKDLVFRAKVLQGLALLRVGQNQQAEECFLDVVYGRFEAGAPNAARPAEMYWFARAVLEAGNLMEERKAWSQAVALYRLAETTIPPEAVLWRERRERIEQQHLIFN